MSESQSARTEELTFEASASSGEVSAVLDVPDDPIALYVFGHGAGAGMRHAFMEAQAARLVERGIATFRYQFPYMEVGRRPPNPRPILLQTVRSAVRAARERLPTVPLIAGGKSMGGRMTSLAQAQEELDGVQGIVFFGFPLHPSGKPGVERADHLFEVERPMLFLQGTRDRLADLSLLRPLLDSLGPLASLELIEEADHSFHVPKRTGTDDEQVRSDLADIVRRWLATHMAN